MTIDFRAALRGLASAVDHGDTSTLAAAMKDARAALAAPEPPPSEPRSPNLKENAVVALETIEEDLLVGNPVHGSDLLAVRRALDALPNADQAALAEPVSEGPSERIAFIAKAVQECAYAWEPDARLLGNVRAEDIADLCSAVLARWGNP